jgi:uncharacterized protein VirK/YbjX
MKRLLKLSTKIYDTSRLKDYRRMMVFLIRSSSRYKQVDELIRFFESDPLRREIATALPVVIEQATRQFFYYKSTFDERAALIKDHFLFLEQTLTPAAIRGLYLSGGINLACQPFQSGDVSFPCSFQSGQKKEGLLSLGLAVGDLKVYQALFWIARRQDGEFALHLGALQGIPGGSQVIHDLTKLYFGYRTKNLVLFALRIFARELGVRRIFAVSNRGFYANNHLRLDRKLRTSLDAFWLETEGRPSPDSRFFELPLLEPRKDASEISPNKRSQYRKRFAALDALDQSISLALKPCLIRAQNGDGPQGN